MRIKIYLFSFFLFTGVFSHPFFIATSKADEASDIKAQKEACVKNKASKWDSKLNRCVTTQTNNDNRVKAERCAALTDQKAKEDCHLKLAEEMTALSSDTNKLYQGNTTKSMIMNSIPAAYSIIKLVSNKNKNSTTSKCTSQAILGVTSVAGLATDVYLKVTTKKKVEELEKKYAVDVAQNGNEAQKSALVYLREEQEMVKNIAGLEKKRNMALMAGYGAATAFAAYEMTFGNNPSCKPNSEKSTEGKSAESESTLAETKTESPAPPSQNLNDTAKNDNTGAAQGLKD